jgi:ABC transporter, substrate-binding protein
MIKKNLFVFLTVATMSLSSLTGCGNTKTNDGSVNTTSYETQSQESSLSKDNAETTKSASLKTEYPLTVQIYNAEGKEVSVTFENAPQRIVSTQLSITELLLQLGLKDKIVGIMDNDNPVDDKLQAELSSLKSLGYKSTISKEAIISVDPDIVMGKSTLMFTDKAIGTVENYLDQGINVYTLLSSADVVDQSLDNIINDIRTVGMIFDVQDRTDAYADSLEKQLNETVNNVSAKTQGKEKMKVILMAGFQDNTFVAFSSSMHSAMLETVNAVNVLDKGGTGLTPENLIALNPDAIVYVTSKRFEATDADAIDRLLNEPTIQNVPAIANKKILKIGYDDIMDYGARDISTVGILANFLYSE